MESEKPRHRSDLIFVDELKDFVEKHRDVKLRRAKKESVPERPTTLAECMEANLAPVRRT